MGDCHLSRRRREDLTVRGGLLDADSRRRIAPAEVLKDPDRLPIGGKRGESFRKAIVMRDLSPDQAS